MIAKLTPQAAEAFEQILALREFLPECPSTTHAERLILENITLREVADVAMALKEWEVGNAR